MIFYNTRDRQSNALAALDCWYQDRDCTILTDGVTYIVGTSGLDRLQGQWEITSPEAIEAEFNACCKKKEL